MIQFPVTIKTHSGYEAVVTNPENRVYHFEVISPKEIAPFTLHDNSPEPDKLISGIEYERARITTVHSELIQFFRFEREKHAENH